MNNIIAVAQILKASRHAVALTGAGISVESGIPPFRGSGGIWEKIDPMEYAHIDAFHRSPAKVWEVLIKGMQTIMATAQPNDGHNGLVQLEQAGILKTVITQNVDGLHQKAGNTDVIEFHGNFIWVNCLVCGRQYKTAELDLSKIPPRCACGGIYRPACVFFGESIPQKALKRSEQVASQCDCMLVIGTSAMVQPAAIMPVAAARNGAKIIEINLDTTPLTNQITDYFLQGTAGEVMQQLLSNV